MAAGLSATGFLPKREVEIIVELQTAFRSAFGLDLNVDTLNPDSIAGQLIGIFAERETLIWELAQAVYDAGIKVNADGILLDNLAALIGLTRLGATPTVATVALSGTATTVVPAGSLISTPSGFEFSTDAEVVIPGSTVATATVEGAEAVGPGAITQISTPIIGWTGVTNAAAASTGRNEESDAQLRVRMSQSTSLVGSSTVDALYARVFEIDEVQSVQVVENATDATVGSLPPHSFEVVVYPDFGDDAAIAQVIWDNKPAGIATYGSETVEITDTQGGVHNVLFSYAVGVTANVVFTYTYNASVFPAGGETTMEEVITTYVDELAVGDDPNGYSLFVAIMNAVPGIRTFSVCTFNGSTVLTMTPNQLAILGTITLNGTAT